VRGFDGLRTAVRPHRTAHGRLPARQPRHRPDSKGTSAAAKKSASDIESLTHSKRPTLLEFYADWCAPCHLVSPILKELSSEFEDTIRLVRVNVDFETALVEKYEVYSVPTIVIIRNGTEVSRITGAKDRGMYRTAVLQLKEG
jgi:thioredoxin 1